MPYHPDIKTSQFEAEKESLDYNKETYQILLDIYYKEMQTILNANGGLESNLGMDNRYYFLRNKYHYVQAKFTKE